VNQHYEVTVTFSMEDHARICAEAKKQGLTPDELCHKAIAALLEPFPVLRLVESPDAEGRR
jgi:hypothetical protein